MVRRPFLRPVAVLLGAVCLINGCHQWKQEPVSAASLNARQLSSARVRMVDGRQFVIAQPRVTGDSLVGHIDSVEPGPASLPRAEVSVRVAVSLTQVSSVQTRHLNGWKTAGLLVGLVVVILGLQTSTCSPSDYFCGR
jgi:hypothetical protein